MKLGIIGFGEVGTSLCEGLKREGLTDIKIYDKLYNQPKYAEMLSKKAKNIKIELVPNNRILIEKSDIIFAVTTAEVALDTANEALPWLDSKHIYVDLNSANPSIKEIISKKVESKRAIFIDGAIMGAPRKELHKTPIVISGKETKPFLDFGKRWHMNLRVVGEKPGQASTVKLIRSIWAKGIEALFLETFHAAETYKVTYFILESIKSMMSENEIGNLINQLVTSDVIHSKRRSYEMKMAAEVLEKSGIDNTMSNAIKEKLLWSYNLNIIDKFKNKEPQNFKEVIQAIISILNALKS